MRAEAALKFFILLFFFGFISSAHLLAQSNLSGELIIDNDSPEINDVRGTVKLTGGLPPFTYQWNKADTPLNSKMCEGNTEGYPVTVVVTDATGAQLELTGSHPPQSNEEHINTAFRPVVDGMASVLFWDPFAAFGVYDPVIYDEQNQPVLNPNGTPRTQAIPFIVVWLVLGAMFFTIRMGFVNFWGWRQAVRLVRGDYDNSEVKGEVTHFQALTTALSATVGLGNIAGVAIAITIGGAGATFWMIIAGLLGMASKFTECTLGVKYRLMDAKGEVSGGPMYYLRYGLERKNMKGLGKVLAFVFAILCVGGSFGGGNMFQANQAFVQVASKVPFFMGNGFWFGILMAVLVGLVILGGIRSIAKVTDKIVPFMVGMYVLTALYIIFANYNQIGEALYAIFDGAFAPDAIKGGALGVLIVGFQRAAFSNEAGVGSASIAHSASKTDHPVSEGVVALLEPFIDTVVVCTMTALVLIFTGYADEPASLSGSQLTSMAFSSVLPWFDWVLLIAIVLFAYSTMISWSYYGLKAWTYLFGEKPIYKTLYKILFLVFVVVGSSVGLGAVLDFSDMMILGMAFPNILGLVLLSSEVRADMKKYFASIRAGEIPIFKKPKLPEKK